MRVQTIMTAVAMLLTACSEGTPGTTDSLPKTPDTLSVAKGATHVVEMVQEGATYRFSPAELTIAAGDQVLFRSVSGGAHNVQFHADSIPTGAAAILEAAIAEKQGPLSTTMKVAGEAITISFAGAPAGEYRFTCLPHMAMGMHGKITVR